MHASHRAHGRSGRSRNACRVLEMPAPTITVDIKPVRAGGTDGLAPRPFAHVALGYVAPAGGRWRCLRSATLDLATRRVTREEREIELTPTEFSLARNCSCATPARWSLGGMLCEHLWETDWEGALITNVTGSLEHHRLRGKLDKGFGPSVDSDRAGPWLCYEQARAVFRSLRFRLTAWNTAVVLLTVLLALFGVREGLRLSLIDELEKTLVDDSLEVSLTVEQVYPDLGQIFNEMNRKVKGHEDRDLFVQLLAPDGKEMFTEPTIRSRCWTDRRCRLHDTGPPISEGTRFRSYRVAQRRIDKAGIPAYIVRVGSSLNMVEEDVAKLTNLIIGAGIVILFLAPLGGFWLSGRATHPLARIITTADRLRPSYITRKKLAADPLGYRRRARWCFRSPSIDFSI